MEISEDFIIEADIIDVIELNNKCKDDKEIKEMLKNKRIKNNKIAIHKISNGIFFHKL